MELLPSELTSIPIPQVALVGPKDLWSQLETILNQHVATTTPREALTGPVGDLTVRLPRFRMCGSDFASWYNKWTNETISTASGITYSGRRSRGIIPLSWFRRIVLHTPSAVVVALDFRNYPLTAQHLWTPAQAITANQIKTEAAVIVQQSRFSLQRYFSPRDDEDDVEEYQSKFSIPKLILLLVFSIEHNDRLLSEEVIKAVTLDIYGIIDSLNGDRTSESLTGAASGSPESLVTVREAQGSSVVFLFGVDEKQLTSVCDLIHDTCRDFYSDEAKLLKRQSRSSRPSSPAKPWRGALQHEISVESNVDTSYELKPQQKQLRLSIKTGLLAEYVNDPRLCLRQYISAWDVVLNQSAVVVGVVEKIFICNFISFRMYQLYILCNDTSKALYHLKAHHVALKEIPPRQGVLSYLVPLSLGAAHYTLGQLLDAHHRDQMFNPQSHPQLVTPPPSLDEKEVLELPVNTTEQQSRDSDSVSLIDDQSKLQQQYETLDGHQSGSRIAPALPGAIEPGTSVVTKTLGAFLKSESLDSAKSKGEHRAASAAVQYIASLEYIRIARILHSASYDALISSEYYRKHEQVIQYPTSDYLGVLPLPLILNKCYSDVKNNLIKDQPISTSDEYAIIQVFRDSPSDMFHLSLGVLNEAFQNIIGTSFNRRCLIILSIHLAHTLFDAQWYFEAFKVYRILCAKLFGSACPLITSLEAYFNDGSFYPPCGIPMIPSDVDRPHALFNGFWSLAPLLYSRLLLCISLLSASIPPAFLYSIASASLELHSPHRVSALRKLKSNSDLVQKNAIDVDLYFQTSCSISSTCVANPLLTLTSDELKLIGIVIDLLIRQQLPSLLQETNPTDLEFNIGLKHFSNSSTEITSRQLYQNAVVATIGMLQILSNNDTVAPYATLDTNPLDLLANLKALGQALSSHMFHEEAFLERYPIRTSTDTVLQGSHSPNRIRLYVEKFSLSVNVKEICNPFLPCSNASCQLSPSNMETQVQDYDDNTNQLILQISCTVHHTLAVPLMVDGCDVWTSLGHQCYNLTSTSSSITPQPTKIFAQRPFIYPFYSNEQDMLKFGNLFHQGGSDIVRPSIEGVQIEPGAFVTFVLRVAFKLVDSTLTRPGSSISIFGIDFRSSSFSSDDLHVSIASRLLFPYSCQEKTIQQQELQTSTFPDEQQDGRTNKKFVLSKMQSKHHCGYISNGTGFICHKLWPPFRHYSSDCFISRPILSATGKSLGSCSTLTWPLGSLGVETRYALADAGLFGLPPPCLLNEVPDSNALCDSQNFLDLGNWMEIESQTQLLGTLPPGSAGSESPIVGTAEPCLNSNDSKLFRDCLVIPTSTGMLNNIINNPSYFAHLTSEAASVALVGGMCPVVVHLSYNPIHAQLPEACCRITLSAVVSTSSISTPAVSNRRQLGVTKSHVSIFHFNHKQKLAIEEVEELELVTTDARSGVVILLPTTQASYDSVHPQSKYSIDPSKKDHRALTLNSYNALESSECSSEYPSFIFRPLSTSSSLITDDSIKDSSNTKCKDSQYRSHNKKFIGHDQFESKLRRAGFEVFRIAIPFYISYSRAAVYDVSINVEFTRGGEFVGSLSTEFQLQAVSPFKCSFRAMPYLDDTLVKELAHEYPSLDSIGENGLENSGIISSAPLVLHHTNSGQTRLAKIPLEKSGHRQFLIVTLHNTSGVPLAVDDIWLTDLDGNCLSSIHKSGSQTWDREKDSKRRLEDSTFCSIRTSNEKLSSPLVPPGDHFEFPAIVGVPEELTIDGKWCGIVDITQLAQIAEERAEGQPQFSGAQPLLLEAHYRWCSSSCLSVSYPACLFADRLREVLRFPVSQSERLSLEHISPIEILATHLSVTSVGIPFTLTAALINNTKTPLAFRLSLVYPPILGLPTNIETSTSNTTTYGSITPTSPTTNILNVPPPPPMPVDSPFLIGGPVSGSVFLPPECSRVFVWTLVPIVPGVLSAPTVCLRSIDRDLPVSIPAMKSSPPSLRSLATNTSEIQPSSATSNGISTILSSQQDIINVFVSPSSQMTVFPMEFD